MGKKAAKLSTSDSKPPLESGSSSDLPMHLAETAWRVALPFLLFSLGGIWLDNRWGSSPLWSMIGVLLAVASVTMIVYRFVNKHYPDTFKRGDS